MKSLLFVGYSANNRTKTSGYEHIVDFKNDMYKTSYLDAAKLPFGFIPVGQKGKRINLYFLELMSHIYAPQFDLIHNFYCDNQLLFKHPYKRGYGAIATTHLNYHNFSKHQINVLKSYDSVIVLNSKEESILKEEGINSVFIPHGFYTPIFKKNKEIMDKYKDYINICFSGVCYRDYEMLSFFLKEIKNEENIILHVLGQRKETKKKIKSMNLPNVILYDFLEDDDYYSIMSMCDYSFLPLIFATANNTLLEAEFLGIKTIIPDIEGTVDYASAQYNQLYKSKEELYSIIQTLRKEEVCSELIEYSEKFQWKNIYKNIKSVYDDVCLRYSC